MKEIELVVNYALTME